MTKLEDLAVAAGRARALENELALGEHFERMRVRAWMRLDRRRVRRGAAGGVVVPDDWPEGAILGEVANGEARVDIDGLGVFRIPTDKSDTLAVAAGLEAADLYGCHLEVAEVVRDDEVEIDWHVRALPFWDGARISLYGKAWPTEPVEGWERQRLLAVTWLLYRL